MDINLIIEKLLPVLAIALVVGSLISVSTEGIKKFLKLDFDGTVARVVTVAVTAFWSWALVIYFGKGTWSDFGMVFAMAFMGATGIYEVIMQRKGDSTVTETEITIEEDK